MRPTLFLVSLLALLAWVLAPSWASPPKRPGKPLKRAGDEIVVCGTLFHTGTRVVTWLDSGGYDAYKPACVFQDRQLPTSPAKGCDVPSRLGRARGLVPEAAAKLPKVPPGATRIDLETLKLQVTQVVVHYDESMTSANCFRVLHDMRGLSCHFLLDLDGTIYQTCDLRERARHAGVANDRSIGIEIAHPGVLTKKKRAIYGSDDEGTYLELPEKVRLGHLKGRRFRPARSDPVAGTIQGRELEQYDFTDAQYEALARLLATLSQVFPKVRLEAPGKGDKAVTPKILSPDELASFEGVIGHYHVSKAKVDPGPAFDWERVLKKARRLKR